VGRRRKVTMLTEEDLKEKLERMKRFSSAMDELESKMRITTGLAWWDLRNEHNAIGDRYIALYSELYSLGYRVRYNRSTQSYEALSVLESQ
jgi:hypothetical protein